MIKFIEIFGVNYIIIMDNSTTVTTIVYTTYVYYPTTTYVEYSQSASAQRLESATRKKYDGRSHLGRCRIKL